VVTCNRRALLEQCLDRLKQQSRPADAVLVVNNASTDGTREMLAERSGDGLEALHLPVNQGGAAGFKQGLAEAYRRGYEWVWLMDDDTLAEPDCLATLLAALERTPERADVMTSAVRWHDARLHPMNRPWVRWNRRPAFAIAADAGLVPIRAATFVSTLVHRRAVARHGLPLAHYFLWLDDIEYTGRLLRESAGYLVPESVAIHCTDRPYDTLSDTRDRFYYKVRNQLWLLRGSSFDGLERITYGMTLVRAIAISLKDRRPRSRAFRVVAKGLRDGLGREPHA
jgi:GT2 family glycosyltransferase